ncbi:MULTISPECIES: sugar ABC transporter permease [Catellatospora]|uniref:Sugar ABC transporter permease n=2 Tax=Catellatospora TaxID=53365 RepID=A0A8J3NYN8_9ACTN|nr:MULTISPECIES: sugar ABC transporter permease [Catellatospora]RKE09361.1 carbohydrate ABC transporter membrane protein 2 (CUT1 family) [Catellatospora citrea]GIF88992.1 sugar ABC transporter permease [Catellatospora chokoriensis]GIF97318.1 sugar ABC transporter permease [Catellatospora citrea]
MIKWLRDVGWRYAVVLVVCAFALFPVVFVVSAAINPLGTLGSTGLVPEGASLSNFHDLLTGDHPFAKWFLNSVIIALISAFAGLLISVAAAYAFSRMRFRGRRVGLLSILLIQMFPQFLAIVAIFIVFTEVTELYPTFGFNEPWGLLVLYLGGALGVNTYLMKGYLDTVPKEIDESATMDGASHVQTFFRIILPLVGPVLAVTAMLSFIGTINEFLIANVFLRDTEAKTLAVGMYGMLTDKRDANFGMFAAATLLTAIPTVSLFLWLQRYIVSGLTAGAVKG